MTRRLIIMRHAKSSWESTDNTDHGRMLTKRGRRDAPHVAEHLSSLGWIPDLVLSSDAHRTRETFDLLVEGFGKDVPVRFSADLYLGGRSAIRVETQGLDDDLGTLMVLGHNPGWEEAVAALTGEVVSMSSANAALLSIAEGTWTEALAAEGQWELVAVVRPRAN